MSEKMGAVEGTKLTDDFLDMERVSDVAIKKFCSKKLILF